MQKKLLDILACPIDKHHPLQLMEFNSREEVVIDGVLTCAECSRFYPIIEEIPVMLPDDLRNKNEDLGFLKRWKERLPAEVVEKGKPYNLS